MVQTFGINSNNDIYLGDDGNLAILSDIDAIVDACETACQAQLGEMVLNNTLGLPNFQTIWVGSPNYQIYQSYLRNTLLAIPGVIEVISLEILPQGNVLQYMAEINTQFGLAEITNG